MIHISPGVHISDIRNIFKRGLLKIPFLLLLLPGLTVSELNSLERKCAYYPPAKVRIMISRPAMAAVQLWPL